MKKQAWLFTLLGALVVLLGLACRKNKAVPPAAKQLSLSLLRQTGGRLIRLIAWRSLAGIGVVWAVGRLCEKVVPQTELTQ